MELFVSRVSLPIFMSCYIIPANSRALYSDCDLARLKLVALLDILQRRQGVANPKIMLRIGVNANVSLGRLRYRGGGRHDAIAKRTVTSEWRNKRRMSRTRCEQKIVEGFWRGRSGGVYDGQIIATMDDGINWYEVHCRDPKPSHRHTAYLLLSVVDQLLTYLPGARAEG